jgi:hypothetical protein
MDASEMKVSGVEARNGGATAPSRILVRALSQLLIVGLNFNRI